MIKFERRDNMTSKERQELRLSILQDLYTWHFENKGVEAQLSLEGVPDENLLAYEYLKEKHLIEMSRMGRSYLVVKITAYGIDHIESMDQ
jgi:hypothetical protein